MPAPRPAADRALTAIAATSVAALALAQAPGFEDLEAIAAITLVAAAAVLAARILALAARAVRLAGLRL
jgi:hypothetical protein